MSVSSSDKPTWRWWALVYIPVWVVFSFALAQVATYLLVQGLLFVHVPLADMDEAMFQTLLSVIIYVLSLVIAVGVPFWVRKQQTTRKELGLMRLPRWMDILLAPAAFIIYGLLSSIILWVVSVTFPNVNWNQAQQVGFNSVHAQYEYLLAFITLVVIAPFAEETLFRGYLFGKLKKRVPTWAAVLATSFIFGGLHLGITLPLQWNVALDTFALSIILCSLRLVTGNIWAGILLHMLKNGIAYYVLFVDQSILRIMGG